MTARPANRSRSFNRRSVKFDDVPPPMRVNEHIIKLCRLDVEGDFKFFARKLLLPFIRRRTRAWEIGEGFQWGKGISIHDARVGRYVFIGPGTSVAGPVSIGDLCMLSSNIMLVGSGHDHRDSTKPLRVAFSETDQPITVIEADCWIGCNAIIHEGVTIRRGTIVGAGAVVTKDTAPYTIVVGSPARQIGTRFSFFETRTYDDMLYGEAPMKKEASHE